MEQRNLPTIPRFENEADEAQWWFDHRHELEQDMLSAARRRGLGEGATARLARKLEAAKIAGEPRVKNDSVPVA